MGRQADRLTLAVCQNCNEIIQLKDDGNWYGHSGLKCWGRLVHDPGYDWIELNTERGQESSQ